MLENALQLALYSKEKRVPLKFLKSMDGKIIDTSKIITDDIASFYMLYKYSIEDTLLLYYHANKDKDDEELSTNMVLFLTVIHEETLSNSYSLSLMKDTKRNFEQRWDGMMENTSKRIEKLVTIKDFFDTIELDEKTKESLNNSFTEENVVKSYKYKYDKFNITDVNIKYIFNNFQTSKNLFYIEFVDSNNQSIIKVHDDADSENLELEETSPNNIYFKYKHGSDIMDIRLCLKTSKIEYSYYAEKDYAEIDNIIRTIFSDFSLTDEKTLFTSGSFNIDIKNYRDYNFYYFIVILINLINKEASNIVYMRETFNPRSLKKRSKYYFRDFENINHIDYIMSFTVDNVFSNLYNIKYRAKNKERNYVIEVAYLIKKFMTFYEDNATTTEGDFVSDYFVNSFYGKKFDYEERSYTKVPTKIATLRNKTQPDLFPSGGEYTKAMCECKLQPIIVDKEDVRDWEKYEDINEKGRKIKHKTIMFPPENSSQGPKKHYVCPTHRYPVPILKPNTGANAKQYPYLPCCKMTGKDNYYDLYEETRLMGKGPIISLKQSDIQSRSLPLPLQIFFKNLVTDEVEIKPTETTIDDSFIGCILRATKGYKIPLSKTVDGVKLNKFLEQFSERYKDVKEFRRNINKFKVHYETVKQEMFDYTIDDIINILIGEEYIDSKLFFKFFEYMFGVNIFVFTIIDDKPVLEKPRYKDFHVRNIIEELPAVFLYREPLVLRARYSNIAGKNFLFSSKNLQNFLQPYYKTDITDDEVITYINPYRGIIWEKIFKDYTILSQKLDSDGKCYSINVKLETYGITVYIPPSAPLNVKVSDRVFKIKSRSLKDIMPPGIVGSNGMWYKINGIRDVFIPCSDIGDNNLVCFNYTRDLFKSKQNTEYKKYSNNSKNSSILIELCIWLWRVSGLQLEEWFETYVVDSPRTDTFDFNLIKVEYILPKYNSVPHCLQWLADQNTEFKEVFLQEKIALYSNLKDNIYLYMKKVESLTDGLSNFPSSYMTSLLTDKEDFDNITGQLIFDNRKDLEDWKNNKFHNLEIYNTLEPRGIYIYQNNKGMYLIVESKTINESMLLVLLWKKYKKIANTDIFTPELLKGVIKKHGYRLYDNNLRIIKEEIKQSTINVISFSSSVYSTFIKLI